MCEASFVKRQVSHKCYNSICYTASNAHGLSKDFNTVEVKENFEMDTNGLKSFHHGGAELSLTEEMTSSDIW